jgi:mannose-6-phosphate isomerase-like protein (cupin superfamily)
MSVVDPKDQGAVQDRARGAVGGNGSLESQVAALDIDVLAASSGARERLVAAVSDAGRFERFVPAVAEMADVSEAQARAWLDDVWSDQPMWEPAAPSARAWWVEGGPRTRGALRGFVHVGAGQTFPHHKHLGAEHVLVLQGGAQLSDGHKLRAGDRMVAEAGDEHSFVATARGPDLLVFTVIFEGLDFGRFVARPRD